MSESIGSTDPKALWVEQFLGLESGESEGEDDAPDVPEFDPAAIRERLNELRFRLRDVEVLPEAEPIALDITAALAALDEGKFAEADEAADAIDEALLELLPRRGEAEILGQSESLLKAAKASLAWRAAAAKVKSQIAKLQATVLSDLEADDDLDPDELDAVALSLARLDEIPEMIDEETIADHVNAIINATGDARTQEIAKTITLVDEYVEYITGSDLIKVLPGNPFLDVDVADLTLAPLRDLKTALAA
jgi:hypothetical protein